jgi:hypothetical protein
MAMPVSSKKASRTLTLEIGGPRITADKFRQSINTFLDILNEVTKEFSGSSRAVKWIVSVRPGSAIIDLKAESASERLPSDEVPVLVNAIQTGLQTIEETATRPPFFNNSTLKKAKDLASIVDGEIDSIRVRRDDQTSSITLHTSANVISLLAIAYRDWGSIEGEISEISTRGESHVYIYDRLLNKHIRCRVDEDTLEEMAHHWKRRVSVTGYIRYYAGGEAKEIEVKEFEVFPDPHTLPGFDEVCGLFKEAD